MKVCSSFSYIVVRATIYTTIKLKSSREKQLLEDSLNATFSDTIDKISREKQLLADSLTQYQVEFAHSLNKAKQAYIDSTQQTLASNGLSAMPVFEKPNVNKQEKKDSQAIDKHYNENN